LKAEGATTSFHRSVEAMLGSLSANDTANALLLLTDGHDFELTSPAKTAALARARRVPIYAIPFGDRGFVRDASVRITNFEPYSYVNQKMRISGSVRLIGCEHETVTVQLLRKNEVIKTVQLNADTKAELPVDFEVVEPETGQYEYEIRLLPLKKESDTENNSAITYLNVINKRIQVLLLEGAPYWDTTFLRRSLVRNPKVDLDAIVQFTPDKARRIRKAGPEPAGGGVGGPGSLGDRPDADNLKIPATQEEFNAYDIIILGKSVDRLLNEEQFGHLNAFVRNHGGCVIFSRGSALEKASAEASKLDPIEWIDRGNSHLRFQIARQGRTLSPFRVIESFPGGIDALPELLAARQASGKKTLAAMLGEARDAENGDILPGMTHRRVGQGQVFSIGVDGLWRWGFNAKTASGNAAEANNTFDRFWDQLVVWLMASGNLTPGGDYSFGANTANVVLGSKVYLQLTSRDPQKAPKDAAVTIYRGETAISKISLTAPDPRNPTRLAIDYLPEKPGRYRAVVTLPDGEEQELRWISFDENLEEKEVATDLAYLTALCEQSGGKVLSLDELPKLVSKLQDIAVKQNPKITHTSLWDRAWFFYLIGLTLGADWYLRRRWGLC